MEGLEVAANYCHHRHRWEWGSQPEDEGDKGAPTKKFNTEIVSEIYCITTVVVGWSMG